MSSTLPKTTPAPAAPALYADDNGRITCLAHGGSYLNGAVSARPKARSWRTPRGTFSLVSAAERAAWPAEDLGPMRCEDCPTEAPAETRPLHPIVPGCPIQQYLDQLAAIETLAAALRSGAHVDNGTQWASVRRLHEMTETLLAWTSDDRGLYSGTVARGGRA